MTADPRDDAVTQARAAAARPNKAAAATGGKTREEVIAEAAKRIEMANSEWQDVSLSGFWCR